MGKHGYPERWNGKEGSYEGRKEGQRKEEMDIRNGRRERKVDGMEGKGKEETDVRQERQEGRDGMKE